MPSTEQTETRTASCQCGAVTVELTGKPIMAATCYCQSCQTAGRGFEVLPGAHAVVGPDGFTRRYGNTIAARIGSVGRDGLDGCVYE